MSALRRIVLEKVAVGTLLVEKIRGVLCVARRLLPAQLGLNKCIVVGIVVDRKRLAQSPTLNCLGKQMGCVVAQGAGGD